MSLELSAYRKESVSCAMEIDGNGSRGIVGFRIVGKKSMLAVKNRGLRCHWTDKCGTGLVVFDWSLHMGVYRHEDYSILEGSTAMIPHA